MLASVDSWGLCLLEDFFIIYVFLGGKLQNKSFEDPNRELLKLSPPNESFWLGLAVVGKIKRCLIMFSPEKLSLY